MFVQVHYISLWRLLDLAVSGVQGWCTSTVSVWQSVSPGINTFLRNWDTVHCCRRRTGQDGGGEKRGRKCQSWAVSTLQTGKRWEASRNSHVVHCPAIQCTTKASLTYIHSKYAFTKFLQAFIYKTGWTANHRGSRGCRVLGAAIRPQCRQHCEQEWENVNSYNLRELQSQPNAD